MQHYIQFRIFIVLLIWLYICAPLRSLSQEVLSSIGIDGRAYGGDADAVVRDPMGSYYVFLEYDAEIAGITVGDTFITANRVDDTPVLVAQEDYYIVKFDSEHNFLDFTVVDNCPPVSDFATSGKYSVLAFNHYFEKPPFPITLQDSISLVPDKIGGALLLFDERLDLVRSIQPTTGRIGDVIIDSQYIYMSCIIPNNKDFILIGEDTVYKKSTEDGEFLPTEDVVLCKFNIEGDSVEWHLRFGGAGNELLYGMSFDMSQNIVIRGETSSRNFSFDNQDIIINYIAYNPFIARYSKDGEYLIGILNTNPSAGHFSDVSFDAQGNLYITGGYYGPDYNIGDTIILNTIVNGDFTHRPFIMKYSPMGVFKWIRQLEGEFERGYMHDIITPIFDNIIVGGYFTNGNLILGDHSYFNSGECDNVFLLKIGKEGGEYTSHQYSCDENTGRLIDLFYVDENSIDYLLRIYGETTIFNHTFYTVGSSETGFHLVNFSTDFTSKESSFSDIQSQLKFFPNPINNNVCSFKSSAFNENDKVQYSISDLNGRILFKGSTSISGGNGDLSIPSLLPGMYSITLQINQKTYSQFLVIN